MNRRHLPTPLFVAVVLVSTGAAVFVIPSATIAGLVYAGRFIRNTRAKGNQ